MNKPNSIFNSTIKEITLPSKRQIITKKKSLSISSRPGVISQAQQPQLHNKGHPSTMVSLIGLTQTALKSDNNPIEEPTISTNEIDKIIENNNNFNDSMTQDLLEIEAKKILTKLTESIYETTKGEYIINAKIIMHNKTSCNSIKHNSPTTVIHNNINNSHYNEILSKVHKHQSSVECVNSLLSNTTKETEYKGSHYTTKKVFSPKAKTDNITLYNDFYIKTKPTKGQTPPTTRKNTKRITNNNEDFDTDMFSFCSKRSNQQKKPKEKKSFQEHKPKKSFGNKAKPLILNTSSNKSTNISLLPLTNSQAITTFFDTKMKNKKPMNCKMGVLSNNIIMHKNNNTKNTMKTHKKMPLQKKSSKQSESNCANKTDYSNIHNSELTQEDVFYSRLYSSNNLKGFYEEYLNSK